MCASLDASSDSSSDCNHTLGVKRKDGKEEEGRICYLCGYHLTSG